jgi:hypothetical protein
LEDLDVDEWIISTWTFKKQDERACTGFIWLRTGRIVGYCEHGNEPSDSITTWEFLYELRNY